VSAARLVAVAGPIAILCVVLGFLASLGRGPLPPLGAGWVAPLHLTLLALGAAAAWAALRRGAEIDRRRFEYTSDPHATKDERALAHREAERDIRLAHVALAGAPLALGYWLAYEFVPGITPWARALAGSALVGYGVALFLLSRRGG
jgi:hypothetical protein